MVDGWYVKRCPTKRVVQITYLKYLTWNLKLFQKQKRIITSIFLNVGHDYSRRSFEKLNLFFILRIIFYILTLSFVIKENLYLSFVFYIRFLYYLFL